MEEGNTSSLMLRLPLGEDVGEGLSTLGQRAIAATKETGKTNRKDYLNVLEVQSCLSLVVKYHLNR